MFNPKTTHVLHSNSGRIVLCAAIAVVVSLQVPHETGLAQNKPVVDVLEQPAPVRAAAQRIQPCKAELASDIPAISFSDARESFSAQGLNLSNARGRTTSIQRAEDMVGSIMFFGRHGKWLYVTDLEWRYDPTRELLAYSRVEGYLHNGQRVSIDKSKELPPTFRVVHDWSQVGPVILRDIDGTMRRIESLAFEITSDGRVIRKELSASSLAASNISAMSGGVCMAGGGITCTDVCWGDCSVTVSDCRCNPDGFPTGFCMTSPGLNCGGDCPGEGDACAPVTPNPGALFCFCVPGKGPGPILDIRDKKPN